MLFAIGCGGSPTGGDPVPDSANPGDAPVGAVTIPTWQLEDVQPQSPRLGQTYGLETFGSKIVVVTLLEGF